MRMVNQAAMVLLALSLLVADARSDERELPAIPSQPSTAPAMGAGSRPSPERMKELIEALAGGHEELAARKAYKELRLSGSAAVPYLTEAVKDKRRNVRWLAVEALGAIGGPGTAPALIEAMGDPDKDVRRYAATFLGQVGGGDAPSLAALRKGLKDEDTEVVLHILWSLDRLGDKAFRQDEALLGRLLAQLTQGQTAWAAQCLGIVRNEKAVEPLVQALRAKPEAAQEIGLALAEIRSRKAVPGLVAILKENSIDSRSIWQAAVTLQKLGDPSANEELLAMTGSSSPWTSLAAVEAIGFSGNKDAITRLSQLATDRKLDKLRREGAVRALGRTEEPSAVAALRAAVVDPEERVANEAAMALGSIKSSAAAAVLRSRLNAESCGHVMYAVTSLGRIGDLSDARAILEVFDRKDALDSTHFANPRMANVATACHSALADITKTQVTDKMTDKNKLFFVISTPQRLQEVREAWRQKLARLNAASRPGDNAAAENDLSVELVFRRNPPAFAAGESIVVKARFVNRTDKPQVYRGGLGDKNIKHSCQVTLTDGGGKAWSARAAAAAPMANYNDIIVPAGGQTVIGEWDLSTFVYTEGRTSSAGGKIPFADMARPGKYRVCWWDGVFQAGTPLRSKPVEFEIAPAATPATRPGAFDLDAAANLLSKEVGGKWEKDKHNALPPERFVLRGRFDSEPGIAAAIYIVFPFGSNDRDMQQLFVKAYANAEGVRWLGANDQCTVLESRAKGEAARVWSERIATTLKLQPLPMVPGAPAAAEPSAASLPATRPDIHGYMDRIRPLLPKGWSARVLADYALCIEHQESPTRIMLRIGERIGGQEEYRRLLAEHENFLKQWNTRFPYGTSMPPNAPAVVLNPPTHFDDRHSAWLQRAPTGPGAEKGMVETKELAAESNTICHSVAELFTPYDSSPPATQPAFGEPAPTTSPATPPSGAAGDGEGLRLQAVLAAGAPVEFLPGQAIPFEVQLVNASRTREHTVVKPGDGSESGWREPYVYYTAERFAAEGRWTPLAPAPTGRCGLFDSQWQKDVVTLKPGESLAIKEWLQRPSSVFEFQQAGRYRIRVHYAYRGGQAHKGAASRPAEDLGGMKGVEPFEVVSDPTEIVVQRPLNVTLKVRGNLVANQPARLSDLLAIAVSNDSDKPISAGQPTLSAEGRLTLQMIAPLGLGPTLDKQNNPHAARMDLQPGRSAPLLGAGEFANGLDGSWTYPRAGTVKLRAGYTPSTWKDIGTVWSDWVEVKVEPPSSSAQAAPAATEPAAASRPAAPAKNELSHVNKNPQVIEMTADVKEVQGIMTVRTVTGPHRAIEHILFSLTSPAEFKGRDMLISADIPHSLPSSKGTEIRFRIHADRLPRDSTKLIEVTVRDIEILTPEKNAQQDTRP
ncbi:MAG: HEAT repeat domain-containing protein [Planctomycetota bacterium]|nr:HEAT repeat domain-containing protein [Planctomycetota bacterium]